MIKDNPDNNDKRQTDKHIDKQVSLETWDTESLDSAYRSMTSQRTTGSPLSHRSSTNFGSFDEISSAPKTVQTSCRLPDRFQRHNSLRDPFRFVKGRGTHHLARQASEQMEMIEKQQMLRGDSKMSPDTSRSWISNVESWKNRRKQKLRKSEDDATSYNRSSPSPQPKATSYTSSERTKSYEQKKTGDIEPSKVPSVEKLSVEEDTSTGLEQPAALVIENKPTSNINRTSGALDSFFESPKQGIITKTTRSKVSKQINEKKIISLQRPNKVKNFGFTICNGMNGKKGVFIATVDKDSVAELNGLEVGDEILEINDIIISGTPYDEIQTVFRDRITLGNMNLKILKTKQTEEEHTTQTVERIGNSSTASKWSPEAAAETTTTTESIQTQGSTRSTTSSYAAKQQSLRLKAYDEEIDSLQKDLNESVDTSSQRVPTSGTIAQKETFSKPERPRKKAFSRSYVEETDRSHETTFSGNMPAYKSSPSTITRKPVTPPPVEPKTWLHRDANFEKESSREPDRENNVPLSTNSKSTRVNVSALKKAFESGNVNKPVVDVTFDAKSLNESKSIIEARDFVEKQMSQLQRDLKDFGSHEINIPIPSQPQIRITRKEEYTTARSEEGNAPHPEPWNQMRYHVSQSTSRTENYIPTYEPQRYSSHISQAPVERSEMTINLGHATAAKPRTEISQGLRNQYYDNHDDYLQRRVAKPPSTETNVRPANRQYYEMRSEQRSYARRPAEKDEHFRSESSFSNKDNNIYTEKYNWSESRTEKMSSISGKERCNACGKELGYGTAMVIETLGICFHTNCFRCSVCNAQLDTNSDGIDVRIRGNRLHCQQCFSTDQAR